MVGLEGQLGASDPPFPQYPFVVALARISSGLGPAPQPGQWAGRRPLAVGILSVAGAWAWVSWGESEGGREGRLVEDSTPQGSTNPFPTGKPLKGATATGQGDSRETLGKELKARLERQGN